MCLNKLTKLAKGWEGLERQEIDCACEEMPYIVFKLFLNLGTLGLLV